MPYFKKMDRQLEKLFQLLSKDERWLILINADPDALASALALKRIFAFRVQSVSIAHVNLIERPDNLAMMRYLRIPSKKLTPTLAAQFDRYALVDSQPHHHPDFGDFEFSLVIDHHPLSAEHPVRADYQDIRPDYGSNSAILTEYLYNLHLKPGKLLATALMYGIKTDTRSFERDFCDADIRAFRYLNRFASQLLLRKVYRSEFRLEWLHYFSKAIRRMRVRGGRLSVFMDEVDSNDILVILADFFLRVNEVSWTIVSGIVNNRLVVVFRGDGVGRDMGKIAASYFGRFGPAGGHKTMARAEIDLDSLNGRDPLHFLWERLNLSPSSPRDTRCA